MNFLKKFFESIWSKVVKPEAEKAVEDFEAKITPDVYQMAEDAVTFVASTLTGNTARDAAVAKLSADLVATGVDITKWAVNELNALVELAYLAVKPTLPPPAQA
jgi:hypothetical protein